MTLEVEDRQSCLSEFCESESLPGQAGLPVLHL